MSDFERDIVHCLNRYFATHHRQGFAYRLKQHKFSTQYVDVLVDSLDPRYYLAVECKSISGKKLYFTQHFHVDRKKIHQVDAISEFLSRTGRTGFLAVEFRFGAGTPKEAYLVPWDLVRQHFAKNEGISLDHCRAAIVLSRSGEEYTLESL